MAYDFSIEMDESFDSSIGVVAAVPAPFSGTVREGVIRPDVIGADFPFLRVIRNFTEEDSDRIVGTGIGLLGFNPGGPIVGTMVGGSSNVWSDRGLMGQARIGVGP